MMFPRAWVMRPLVALLAIACMATAQTDDHSGSASAGAAPDQQPDRPDATELPEVSSSAVGIRFHGLVPGAVDPSLNGSFEIRFRLYASPQGGEPLWSETRVVTARRGEIDVLLGEVEPIPMELHEATFRFLGAAIDGQREVYPRYAVVNVVFVSQREALVAVAEGKRPPARGATGDSDYGTADEVSAHTERGMSWRQALQAARARGEDLPDYEAWYGALGACSPETVTERADHYEWVLPWVYDPASHGRYNRYFRGRFEGCDYMDLSPMNVYPWRAVQPATSAATEEVGR